ncbi:MAG: ABC transporter ATP-binding protein [Clostridia bacterium]|nr:ABC transporter ATP-binding protein [Clostridia bacterium]
MIKTEGLTKKFGEFTALDSITCTIGDGSIYGMIGSNGAGKSTFLRTISGVYRADAGSVTADGDSVWNNPSVKGRMAFVPDDIYFFAGANMERMANAYASIYKTFDRARFRDISGTLGLDTKKALSTFSKGMRRQAATILALSVRPEYIFFDETFDGLDPVMRNLVKKLIYEDVMDRGTTAVITSHSLRELEDTCDQLALLHRGGLVLESDIQELKTAKFKIQIAFDHDYSPEIFEGIEVSRLDRRGSVTNMIVSGDREETVEKLKALHPILLEVLPLSLEEIFTYEMEALGYAYDIKEVS